MPPRQQQSARLARYNRAVVLDLIRSFGPLSKPELAARSGLALSSVMNVVSSLSRRGLVRHVGSGPSTGGRRPTLVELNPGAHYAVGANIRIAGVEAVMMDLVGDIVAETALPLRHGRSPEAVADTVVEAITQVVHLGHVDPARLLGVGIGCPGPVVSGRTVMVAPSLPGWRNVPLAEHLEARLGLPVTLENDANLGALAEYRYGIGARGKRCESLVYIYADHGIGAGIVVNGSLYRGVDGLAGEMGHTVIDIDGRRCVCGTYGCVEALASVGAIVQRAALAGKLSGSSTPNHHSEGDWDAVSYAAIMDALADGDPIATTAVEEAMAYLATAITNVVRQLHPEIVIIGGELFDHNPQVFQRLLSAMAARPSFYGSETPPAVQGDLGSRAPCIGAGTLILENFFGVPHQVMQAEPAADAVEPAFEQTPVWPPQAEDAVQLQPSTVRVLRAGNLKPGSVRVRVGEPILVSVDLTLDGDAAAHATEVKVLLHWDRVALFGGSWPNPKDSPMHLAATDGTEATYTVTLGSLPPGKYEYAARILAANHLWVPERASESNGRIEVLPQRISSDANGHREPANRAAGRPVKEASAN